MTPDSSRDIDQVSGAGDTHQVALRVKVSLGTVAAAGYSEDMVFSPIKGGGRQCSGGSLRARLDKKRGDDFLSRVYVFYHSFFYSLSHPPFLEFFCRELRLSYIYIYIYMYIYIYEIFFPGKVQSFFREVHLGLSKLARSYLVHTNFEINFRGRKSYVGPSASKRMLL